MTFQYISELFLDFSGDARTRFALEMHHISAETAAGFVALGNRTPVELEFDRDRLVGAKIMGDMSGMDPGLVESIIDLPHASSLTPLSSPPVSPLVLTEDETGRSRIGGQPPADLVLPEAEFASGYHYIGELDLLHTGGAGVVPLLYPLFVDYHPPVFLDVSDPLRPELFSPGQGQMVNLDTPSDPFSTGGLPYGAIRESDEIADIFASGGLVTFQEYRGRFEPADPSLPSGMVTAGIPDWLQPPELPICPKTGVPMRFAAEIGGGLPVEKRDVEVPAGSLYAENFETLTFWNLGVLYVFANPEAGTLCLHPQDI